MSDRNLILIRGIPGSGKTTLASSLRRESMETVYHYEADMYFMRDGEYCFDRTKLRQAHAWCQESTEQALFHGYNAIVSNTFTTRKELKPYFQMIQKYGKQPTVYHCQSNWGSIHGVPDDVLAAMRDRFEYDLTPLFEMLPEKG